MYARFWVVTIITGILLLSGCSSGPNPAQPDITEPVITQSVSASSHSLWGFYDIFGDSESGEIEVIPLRSTEFTANVTRFLQPPIAPINLLTISLEIGSDIPNGLWVLDITVRHPFLEFSKFRGFDVRGIIMSEGGVTGMYDPSVNYHAVDGTRLLNPDGYSRWWNETEFTAYGTIFGYTEGAKAVPGDFATATINPYKLFSDDLDEVAPVNSIDQASRATFSTFPGVNTRRYKIQFDLDGGPPPIRFKYAIDASWSLPDPAYAPDYPVEAFDLSANCQEPYLLMVPFFEEKPFFEDPSNNGGNATFFLTIGDWQAVNNSVLDQVSHVWVESPTLMDAPVDVLPSMEFVSANGSTQATYRVMVPDLHPTGLEGQRFLITVESANPDTYKPQIEDPAGFPYPDSPLAAYLVVDVPIDTEGPPPPPDDYFVIGLPDWCSLTEGCTTGADNLVLIENLVTWDLEGPYNDNRIIKWWSGHLNTFPPYSTSIFSNFVQGLGYQFEHTSEPAFNADGCRMVLVNFVTSSDGSTPFTEDEVRDMKDFVKGGGLLAFLIESPPYSDLEYFDPLMEQLGVPLSYGGPAEPPATYTQATDISSHYLTNGVHSYQYWTCGEFTLESPDVESLVRTDTGEHIVVVAPIDVG